MNKENRPILDLRIIALQSATVVEVLARDDAALGFNTPLIKVKSDSHDFVFDVLDDEDDVMIFETDFDEIRQHLNTFAEQGVFWRDEKPVPRWEECEMLLDCRILVGENGQRQHFEGESFDSFKSAFKDFPIYKPRTFQSKWVREFPSPFDVSSKGYAYFGDGRGTVYFNNPKSDSNFEVWRFKMWEVEQ